MVKTMMHPVAGEINLLNMPWHMSATPGELRASPPVIGHHTSEVIIENGFEESEIEELKNKGVIWGN
jgi:crotonobetainyl-CoA:carnitine CoA-transferase CaiB-like acyl-CoA transferase